MLWLDPISEQADKERAELFQLDEDLKQKYVTNKLAVTDSSPHLQEWQQADPAFRNLTSKSPYFSSNNDSAFKEPQGMKRAFDSTVSSEKSEGPQYHSRHDNGPLSENTKQSNSPFSQIIQRKQPKVCEHENVSAHESLIAGEESSLGPSVASASGALDFLA